MGIFNRFGKRREETPAFRRSMAKRLDGMAVKYVTERDSNADSASEEAVIGRGGALIVKASELLVYSDADVVFRGDIDRLSMSQLLSGDGVIIEGEDTEHGGKHRKIIAYYTYHLKI